MTVAVKQKEVFNRESQGHDITVNSSIPSPKDQLQALCMRCLKDLDLSRNLKFPFIELVKLISYFPSLETLQVSDSPMLLSTAQDLTLTASRTISELTLTSTRITKLVFNNTGFKSVCTLRVLVELPALEELHLDSNNIGSFRLFLSNEEEAMFRASLPSNHDDAVLLSSLCFSKVTTLSLAHNKLHSWAAEDLGETLMSAFPVLTHLYLDDNQMPDVILEQEVLRQHKEDAILQTLQTYHSDTLAGYTFLKPLRFLCLKDNPTLIDSRTIDAVRILCPCLEAFRITYSTLFPQWNDTLSRMYVVASLPTIELLNRGQVRPKERLDSEIFYIQRGMSKQEPGHHDKCKVENGLVGVEVDTAAQLSAIKQPDYYILDTLFEKHKDVVLSIYREDTTASTDGSSHIMLNVTLHCENNFKPIGSNRENMNIFNTVKKTLPSNIMIAKLKSLIRIVFQIEPTNQALSFRSGDTEVLDMAIAMDNEQQTLAYYGVSDGARIMVRDTSLR
ncbi:unnamed protein product [Phytomonas sp. Hart1]|nr:unnamed protein product [Phytomonas sp. Hart1]|eukprot:CCW68861.1 unnamed protein product [Phytomonas sp. isolate Hart1]